MVTCPHALGALFDCTFASTLHTKAIAFIGSVLHLSANQHVNCTYVMIEIGILLSLFAAVLGLSPFYFLHRLPPRN
jgi:hypothetical protein